MLVYSVMSNNVAFHEAERPPTLEAVVEKEALYCAIGRCAMRLKDTIQLEKSLQTFYAEAQDPDPK